MSLITRAGDLVYTFRFLKLLVTPFTETDAFKLGLIDEDGKRIKSETIDDAEKKSAYTAFHRLVFNVKRLMAKAPGGSSKIASYAAALYLIREHFNLSDKNLKKLVTESRMDVMDFLAENSQWYVLDDKMLSPGVYRIRNEKVLSKSLEPLANEKDKVRVADNSFPIAEVFGIDIYEATHVNSNQKIHVAVGEIYK